MKIGSRNGARVSDSWRLGVGELDMTRQPQTDWSLDMRAEDSLMISGCAWSLNYGAGAVDYDRARSEKAHS